MSLESDQMKTLFRNLVRAFYYDQMMYRRITTGQLVGFYHPGEGAQAPGVGAATFLREDDLMNPHHRGHGMAHMLSKGIDLKYYLAEHTGKETGCCKGRSAFHWSFPSQGVHFASGFIGMNFSPVIGMGWACSFDFESLRAALPEAGLWWLTAGGLAYTGGILFYVLDKMQRLKHAHGIWHFFVMIGSICHFVSIIGYLR